MEIVGEFLGFGSDKAIYEYFKTHWLEWFPNRGTRTTFATQTATLCFVKEKLRDHLMNKCKTNDLHLFDGFQKSDENSALIQWLSLLTEIHNSILC
jgi:hypothetical protein